MEVASSARPETPPSRKRGSSAGLAFGRGVPLPHSGHSVTPIAPQAPRLFKKTNKQTNKHPAKFPGRLCNKY